MLFGALEAGGTKMICAVGNEKGEILEKISVPTTTPEDTMPKIIDFFRKDFGERLAAIGVACFGPIDMKKDSPTYGYITSTPKTAWKNYDILGEISKKIPVPIGFETDVNGSLLGEATWGAAKGLSDVIYLTIGTGVGGGVMSGGKLLHGMLHPELGHMLIERETDDMYAGKCPYHKTCFEGLAAGPAIEERYGRSGSELSDEQAVWELESRYIAKALVNLILTVSPERIILGGGVMHQLQLFPMIRERVAEYLNGYIETGELKDLEHYIVPAGLKDDQGIMGAIKLAMECLG